MQASDVTSPAGGSMVAWAPVTISVLDANDEAPTFSRQVYSATLLENSPVGTPLSFDADITVQDLDQVLVLFCTFYNIVQKISKLSKWKQFMGFIFNILFYF